MERWTPERVKRELPDVVVRHGNPPEYTECRTAGRALPFAAVYNPQTGAQWEFAWTTLARAMEAGRPLLA